MPRIHREIEIDAPATQVWTYVGTEPGLRQWWGQEIWLEAKEGGRCEEKGTLDGVPFHRIGKVTIYDPPRQLTLAFQETAAEAWPSYITVSLTLAEANGRTIVTVVQQAHDIGQSAAHALPAAEIGPQPGFHPPLLQAGAQGQPAGDAPGYTAPWGTSSPRRGQAIVQDNRQPYEHVWQIRLAALKQQIHTS